MHITIKLRIAATDLRFAFRQILSYQHSLYPSLLNLCQYELTVNDLVCFESYFFLAGCSVTSHTCQVKH